MRGSQEQQTNYLNIARRYRPQRFSDVVSQEAVVTTLKNAIKQKKIANAYLFCGPRGTGKTTLARLFAKALNCLAIDANGEPCNQCACCREITSGSSMDVLEIDGASNRGIEDIRKINDSVGFASSSAPYKVYIIDEVHMLTKEAFNALLKTLEEPPEKVLFLFATTEPHKVLPTILSRCQRFNLKRFSNEQIEGKLQLIAKEMQRQIAPSAIRMIASRAEGGLRDAECLLDQIFAFNEGEITEAAAADLLGSLPQSTFFELDRAGSEGNLAEAFLISSKLFDEGKDLANFMQALTIHFRTLLAIHLAGINSPILQIDRESLALYEESSSRYSKEQLLTILDLCIDAESAIKSAPSQKVALEHLLLKIMRTHKQIPIDVLVKKLSDLESKLANAPAQTKSEPPQKAPKAQPAAITEDPTPASTDLPKALKKELPASKPLAPLDKPTQVRHDMLMQFAAVELEGKLIKK